MAAQQRASVIKNYLYNLSYQILLLIVPLITMPYLARTLGIDNQGTFSVLLAVINCFIMLGRFGLDVYGQREIAYYRHDTDTCNRIFWEIETIRIVTLSASLVIYFVFVLFNLTVISIVNVTSLLYFALFALEIVAAMFDISWYYQGLENFKLQTVRNFAVKIISLILIFTLVKSRSDLWLYIVIHAGMNLLGNATLWIDRLKTARFRLVNLRRVGRHLRFSFIMLLPQIATTVYAQLDRVMVGGLVNDGNFQAGVYDNAEKIVKIALTVVTSLGLVMLSRVANAYMQEDKNKLKEYITNSFRVYTCLATPIMFGLAAISSNFVPYFFSNAKGAEQITPVMLALCPIILFIGGSNVFGTQYLLPTNRMKPYTGSVFVGMTINIIFNFILVPTHGALGAAIATVIAELGVLVVQLIAVRREFSALLYLKNWRYFVAGGVMCYVVYKLGTRLTPSLSHIFIQISVGIVLYFGLVMVLGDKFVLKYVKQILNKFKKK